MSKTVMIMLSFFCVAFLLLGLLVGKAIWDKEETVQDNGFVSENIPDSVKTSTERDTVQVRVYVKVPSENVSVEEDTSEDAVFDTTNFFHHIAEMDTLLADEFSETYLWVRYKTFDHTFEVDWQNTYYIDSTYTERIKYVPVERLVDRKLDFISAVIGGEYRYSFDASDPVYCVRAGVSIYEHVDILVGIDTEKYIGVSLNVRF